MEDLDLLGVDYLWQVNNDNKFVTYIITLLLTQNINAAKLHLLFCA